MTLRARRPRRCRPRFLTLALLVAATLPGPVAAQDGTTNQDGPLFDSRDAWIAGAYLATASLAFPFDEPIALAIRDSLFQERPGLRATANAFDYLAVPGTLILSGGMYGVGRLTDRPGLADVGLHMGEAIIVAEVVTYGVKILAGRARPRLDINNPTDFKLGRGLARESHHRSFPSGHTAAAFAAAAVAAHEFDRLHGGNRVLVGILTYGPASLAGVARMFGNNHWTSDVVFGAAIGAFSGWKVVRYSHQTNPDNTVDQWLLSISVPTYDWRTARIGLVPLLR